MVALPQLRVEIAPDELLVQSRAEPATDYNSGERKTDDNGQPLVNVDLALVKPGERPGTMRVRVPESAAHGQDGQPVQLEGATAIAWSNGDRGGVSYRAESIKPLRGGGQRQE